ncbi:MAG: hypothetical protein ACUVWP_05225 [bacterium]
MSIPEDVNVELEKILKDIGNFCEEAIECWNMKREMILNCAVKRKMDVIDIKLLNI